MLTLQKEITLKELLKQQNINQIMLSKKLNMNRSYVSKLINTPLEQLSWKNIQLIINTIGLKCSILVE